MTLPAYIRSPLCIAKRLRIVGLEVPACLAPRGLSLRNDLLRRNAHTETQSLSNSGPVSASASNVGADSQQLSALEDKDHRQVRLPRSVQAVYLRPLRRQAKYGIPVCDLQLRSYSVRNVEFFADFALRAAYYLNLPASGPVPLPRITERWTVPRSHFIFKKSQENFERITLRRLIQIKDGNSETVQLWLAFLRKHAYYGIGMKANVWEHEELGVGKTMDADLEDLELSLKPKWMQFGRKKSSDTAEKVMQMMGNESYGSKVGAAPVQT